MPDYNQTTESVPIPNYHVYTKATWETASWTLQPNLVPLSLTLGANQQSAARVLYQAGRVLREGSTEFVDAVAEDLTDQLLMIETYRRLADGSDGELLDRWIGIIEQDDRDVLGETDLAAVDQVFTVFGMERLLDARTIKGSWIMGKRPTGSETVACHIDTPLMFNAPAWGTSLGQKNRHFEGATQIYNPFVGGDLELLYNAGADAGFSSPSAFGMLTDDAASANKDLAWNIGEVLNYLVSFFGPIFTGIGTSGAVGFRIDTLERVMGLEPTPAAEKLMIAMLGSETDPASAEVYGFSPEGKTVFECLNELFSPSRGFGWTIRYHGDLSSESIRDGTKGPWISIFTVNEATITVGTATLPGTPLKADLEVTGRNDVHYSFGKSSVHNYGRITVVGERILSCFSLSGADGSLDKGWTSQEETEFATPPGLTPETDAHKIDEFQMRSRAWREFIVKPNWDFKAKNGETSGTPAVVNPIPNPDGTLLEKPATVTRRDKRFEEWVPIPFKLPEGATTPPEPLYSAPKAFVKWKGIKANVWLDLFRNTYTEGPQARMRMLDDRFGVELITSPRWILNNNGTRDLKRGSMTVNWSTEMILTLAYKTEKRCSYTITTSGNILRELVLYVPNAELWLVAPNTVTGVDKDGALVRTSSDLAESVVRDDRYRLKQVAAMAQAWYGQLRRGMRLSFQSLTYRLPTVADPEEVQELYPGLLVETVHEVTPSDPVNTVIWTRQIDYMQNQTVYLTAGPALVDFTLNRRKAGKYRRRGARR